MANINNQMSWDDPNLWEPIGRKGGVPINVILRTNYTTNFINRVTKLINEISIVKRKEDKWHKKSQVESSASHIFVVNMLD